MYEQTTPSASQPFAQRGHSMRRILVGILLASFLLGAVAGGAVGVLGAMTVVGGHFPTAAEIGRFLSTGKFVNGTVAGSSPIRTSVEENSATIDAVKKVSPAVVSVILKQDLSKLRDQNSLDPFNGFFFSFPFSQPQQPAQPQGKEQVSAGSGFIISPDGLILTNKHVVQKVIDNTDVELTVVFSDGTEHSAKVLGADPLNDLAIIKIEGKNLPTMELGDSSSLQLGQSVIAIGNALGRFTNTVTVGVVSGMNRTVEAGDQLGQSETIEEAIQTDAAINHGNSGGPLINLSGQAVGVNTAIDEQGQLVGFAIPINAAKQIVDSVLKNGKIERPYLGVRYILITPEVQKTNNLSVDHGALIVRGSNQNELAVIPGSPADKAGLVENDIILEVNGQKVGADNTLSSFMRKANVGDTLTMKIMHRGDEKSVTAKLEAYDGSQASSAPTP